MPCSKLQAATNCFYSFVKEHRGLNSLPIRERVVTADEFTAWLVWLISYPEQTKKKIEHIKNVLDFLILCRRIETNNQILQHSAQLAIHKLRRKQTTAQ